MKLLSVLLATGALLAGCASDGFMGGLSGRSDTGTMHSQFDQSSHAQSSNPVYPDLYFGD